MLSIAQRWGLIMAAFYIVNWICIFSFIRSGSCLWITYDSKCYWISQAATIFSKAGTYCVSLNSSILATETISEFKFITNTIKDNTLNEYWVDMKGSNGYKWKDKTSPVTSMWSRGEPNHTGDCVRLKPTSGKHQLADHPCTNRYHYICEKYVSGGPIYTVAASKTAVLPANQCPFQHFVNIDVLKCAKICAGNPLCSAYGINKSSSTCWLYTFQESCSVIMASDIFYAIKRSCT